MIRRFLDWLFRRPVDAVPDDDTDMIEEMEAQRRAALAKEDAQ